MSATAPLGFDGDLPLISDVDAAATDASTIDLTGASPTIELAPAGTDIDIQIDIDTAAALEARPKVVDPTDDPAMRVVYLGLLLFVAIVAISALLALS